MSDINTASDTDETQGAQRGAVGVLLRDTRISQGFDIADVARALRIAKRYLEALENDRDQDLPGPTYAIGFVRSYCEHLGLDSEEIVRRYKDSSDVKETQTELVFPKPISDGGVPGAVVLGVGLVIAAVAYGVWYWQSSANTLRVAQVDPVPAYISGSSNLEDMNVTDTGVSPQTPVSKILAPKPENLGIETLGIDTPADGTPATAPAREQIAKAQVTTEPAVKRVDKPQGKNAPQKSQKPQGPNKVADNVEKKAQVSAGVSGTDESQPSAAEIALVGETPRSAIVAKAAPVRAPATSVVASTAGATSGATSGVTADTRPSRITVQAKSNSWIQIRDEAANRLLFTRLLRQGDSYKVPDRAGLRLMTGNAGALEIFVDGKIVPSLGAVGEVRRDVELDPGKLKSGTSVAN